MRLGVEEVGEVVVEGVGEDRTDLGKGEGNDLPLMCDTHYYGEICSYSKGLELPFLLCF